MLKKSTFFIFDITVHDLLKVLLGLTRGGELLVLVLVLDGLALVHLGQEVLNLVEDGMAQATFLIWKK